jgi:hypothetical protein
MTRDTSIHALDLVLDRYCIHLAKPDRVTRPEKFPGEIVISFCKCGRWIQYSWTVDGWFPLGELFIGIPPKGAICDKEDADFVA